MLHEFLTENRKELAARCRAKVAERPSPQATTNELEFGIPLLIEQLVIALRPEQVAPAQVKPASSPPGIGASAAKHGSELLRAGFTVDQVVHDYGDLCQALTELAHEKNAPITVDEFHGFNRCLDDAIADAVTEFARQRDQLISAEGIQTMNERLGCFAHELRTLLNTAMLAFLAIERGKVTLTGATGAVLGRSLIGLRDLIDRSLADVRLTEGLQVKRESISIRELLDETQISATLEAKSKGLTFAILPVDAALLVDGDRQMLSSAVANLLQNAFKFTRPYGHVSLAAHAAADRVLIDIEDECGGLPPGKVEELFQPFKQQSSFQTEAGLGLSISRRAVEANGGKVRVRDIRGTGCIFTIDLPRPAPAQ
jgi:signal transduction histidine kinase